jgi:DNA-binding MarR family transcriptional regulator
MDPWLTSAPAPAGTPLTALVNLLAFKHLPAATRANAKQRRLEVLSTVLANFICSPPPHAIAVPQGRLATTRYDRPVITGRQLKPTLDALEPAGLIIRHKHQWKKRRTIIEPTAALAALIATHKVTTAAIVRLPGEEVIILKMRQARNATANDDGEDDQSTIKSTNDDSGDLIDYPDDCQEATFERSRLRKLNEFLFKQDIRVIGIDCPPPPKPFKRIFSTSGPIITFNKHGRLYAGQIGAWHQALPKDQRHLIRINGEPVCDLDFTSIHLRLAYAEAKCTPPDGDLYAIPALGLLEASHRPAIKIVISAMLSRTGELTKLPPEARQLLPREWTGPRIAQAIKEYHAPIAHLFGIDKGIEFMWQDSEILMLVLERLMDKGIPALPMHDGIMVQESAKDVAIEIMSGASRELVGVALPVDLKAVANGA